MSWRREKGSSESKRRQAGAGAGDQGQVANSIFFNVNHHLSLQRIIILSNFIFKFLVVCLSALSLRCGARAQQLRRSGLAAPGAWDLSPPTRGGSASPALKGRS